MKRKKILYNASSKDSFVKALESGMVDELAVAFIKDTREIWARGVYYPCDFSAPFLSEAPSSFVLTYTDSEGYERSFVPGQACVYRNADVSDGYGIAFLKAVENGSAVWQDMGEVLSLSAEANTLAKEANAYSKNAYTNSNDAVRTAEAAKNAVATLAGLADADEAQKTLAGQVTQITQNTSDIETLKQRHVLISTDEYDALEVKDQTKIYMLYEE